MTEKEFEIRDRQTYPFVLLPKAFFKIVRPTPHELAIYVALKYYANNAGTCERIAVRTLAKLAAISETSAKAALKELERKGAIRIKHRSTKSTAKKKIPLPNLYEILNLNPEPNQPI